MPATHRGRTYGIAAASLAAHAALLAVLAVYAPKLRVPEWKSGPPPAIIPVLIMPRVPPPAAQPGAKPEPIRLHRRPQRFAEPPPPVKPLVAPEEEARRAASTPGPRTLNLPGPGEAVAANARNALRGRLGCANPDAVGLTPAEREACERRFAAGAKGAAFPGLGIDSDKAAGLDAAAAQKERDYKYRRSGGAPGTVGAGPSSTANAPGGRVNLPGASASDIGSTVGSDRPSSSTPF
jgi:hypothetical protein